MSMQARKPLSVPPLNVRIMFWTRSLMASERTALLSSGSMSSKNRPWLLGYLGFFQPRYLAK